MKPAMALVLLLASTVHGAPRRFCAPCNVVQKAIVHQPYAIAAVKQQYIAYQPVQYQVAPWVQAQAQDTYHFRGSEERLELERLRGYVAAVQRLTQEPVVEEPEPTPEFDQQPAQPHAAWNQPQAHPALPTPPPNRALTQVHCAKCHSGPEPAGGFELSANTVLDDEKVGAVVRVLANDGMPLAPDRQTPAPLDPQTKFDLLMELGAMGVEAQPENAIPQPPSI